MKPLIEAVPAPDHRQIVTSQAAEKAAAALIVQRVRDTNEFDQLESGWDALVDRSQTHIFIAYPWQRLWWKCFGQPEALYLITFYHDQTLVGLAPFHIDERKWNNRTYRRTLRFIGGALPSQLPLGIFSAYGPSDYLDVIAAPGYEEAVMQRLSAYLSSKAGIDWDEIALEELPENGLVMKYQHLWTEHLPGVSFLPGEVCPAISTDGRSFDEMIQHVESSNTRYNIRRSLRYVTDKSLFSIRKAESVKDVEKLFRHFVSLHQRRWNQKGHPGIFEGKEMEVFLLEALKTFYHRGWLWFTYAEHEGEIIAVDCSFTFNQRIYNYQKALDDQHEMARLSPGYVLILTAIKEMAELGWERYEYLRGDEVYKFKFQNQIIQNYKLLYRHPATVKSPIRLLESLDMLQRKMQLEKLIWNVHRRENGIFNGSKKYLSFTVERLKNKASR